MQNQATRPRRTRVKGKPGIYFRTGRDGRKVFEVTWIEPAPSTMIAAADDPAEVAAGKQFGDRHGAESSGCQQGEVQGS